MQFPLKIVYNVFHLHRSNKASRYIGEVGDTLGKGEYAE